MRACFILLAIALLFLGGCQQQPSPAVYRHWFDRVGTALGLNGIVFSPCERKVQDSAGTYYEFTGFDDCYRFQPARRMQGIWISEFEGSFFLSGARSSPAVQRYGPHMIWLAIGDTHIPTSLRETPNRRAFLIDFIGRQSLYPGRYGGGGGHDQLVIVDHIIGIHEIAPPSGSEICDEHDRCEPLI